MEEGTSGKQHKCRLFMNKKERFIKCLDNQPIDRPPVTFWHHYKDASPAEHLKTYSQIGVDMIKMMSDGYNDISFGVTVNTAADWKHVKMPDMKDPFVTGQIDRIRGVVDAVGNECAVYYVVFSAFTLARMSWNREMCFAHIKDPETRPYILKAIDNIGDFLAEMSTTLITEGGLLGLLPCFNTNGHTQFTAEQYSTWQRPQDLKLLNAINQVSNYNIAHFCGYNGIKNNISSWYDYPAAAAHWDIHTDEIPLCEGRKTYPNVRAIMGGFNNKPGSLLYEGTKEQVQVQTLEYVREGGRSGYVVSADCSLSPDVSYQRLRWVVEALDSIAQPVESQPGDESVWKPLPLNR